MTAAVVAMFCLAAFAFILGNDGVDADEKKTFEIYAEVIADDGSVSDTVYVYFEAEANNESYVAAANAAFTAAGIQELQLSINSKGRVSANYNGGGSSKCYFSDGEEWNSVSSMETDYITHTKMGLAVNNGFIGTPTYEALPDVEKLMWHETGMGDEYGPYAYEKILEIDGAFDKILNYTVDMTLIDDDLVRTTTQTFTFQSENAPEAWAYAINNAVKGNSVFSKLEVSNSLYLSFDGSYSNATYYLKDKEWVACEEIETEYLSGAELDFELKNGYISEEKYNGLSKSEQACWKKTGYGGEYEYIRLAQATPAPEPKDSNDNTMLYIGIAVVVIVVIAAGVFFFVKKKNA